MNIHLHPSLLPVQPVSRRRIIAPMEQIVGLGVSAVAIAAAEAYARKHRKARRYGCDSRSRMRKNSIDSTGNMRTRESSS